MECHVIPWPEGARFARLRIIEDGIPRSAEAWFVPTTGSDAPGVLCVQHLASADVVPLDFVVEESPDGVSWATVGDMSLSNLG